MLGDLHRQLFASKPILQSEGAECALACVANVCNIFGSRWSLSEMRQSYQIGSRGTSVRDLLEIAEIFGLQGRVLKAELLTLGEVEVPCVLHWNFNHFVVLERTTRYGLQIIDPAVGRLTIKWAEAGKSFTGILVEMTRTEKFSVVRSAPQPSIFSMLGPPVGLGKGVAQIAVVTLVLEGLALLAPLASQLMLDGHKATSSSNYLLIVALAFVALLFVQTTIAAMRTWMLALLGQRLSFQWLSRLFSHLLSLPGNYFESRTFGDISSRFGSIHSIKDALTKSLLEVLIDGVLIVFAAIIMLAYSVQLALVVFAAALILAAIRWVLYFPLRNAAAERLIFAGRETTHFIESLRAIIPLKLNGRELERVAAWQNLVVDVQNRDLKTNSINILVTSLTGLVSGVEVIVVLYLGVASINASSTEVGDLFTVGMLLAFLGYRTVFVTRLNAMLGALNDVNMLGLHKERIADIASAKPEEIPLSSLRPVDLSPSLELVNVSFRYSDAEPWVLRNLNLKIEPTEILSITGVSGCGKSTLIKIVLGLLEPTEGEVRYGGVAVRALGIKNFRSVVGAVLQDDLLLRGSVIDNISFFDPAPDMDRLKECARMAQIDAEVMAMPMRYQTMLNEDGGGLSGGQVQRILLARALYKRPRLLVMDEATSHLDVDNERAIAKALGGLQITQLVVAHRAETLANSDRKMVMRRASAGTEVLPQFA